MATIKVAMGRFVIRIPAHETLTAFILDTFIPLTQLQRSKLDFISRKTGFRNLSRMC